MLVVKIGCFLASPPRKPLNKNALCWMVSTRIPGKQPYFGSPLTKSRATRFLGQQVESTRHGFVFSFFSSPGQPSTALKNPMQLFSATAFHGGAWRTGYKFGTIGPRLRLRANARPRDRAIASHVIPFGDSVRWPGNEGEDPCEPSNWWFPFQNPIPVGSLKRNPYNGSGSLPLDDHPGPQVSHNQSP